MQGSTFKFQYKFHVEIFLLLSTQMYVACSFLQQCMPAQCAFDLFDCWMGAGLQQIFIHHSPCRLLAAWLWLFAACLLKTHKCFQIPELYQDQKNGVTDGACTPLLIHTDKSKTKEKEKREREKHCSGEDIPELCMTPRSLAGLSDLPDIWIETISSRSMTQEVFYAYAKHFVLSLPAEHGPVILFLDGHGSCWSVPALWYLMRNKVFPFFSQATLASGCNPMMVAWINGSIEWLSRAVQKFVMDMILLQLDTSIKISGKAGTMFWVQNG